MDKVECVVIGAGVIGLAVARRLAQAGREVIILAAAEGIGTVTSSRNSEVIHAGIYYPAGSLMARMCVSGKRALYEYCGDHGIPHRNCGKLIVATTPKETLRLQSIRAHAEANGVLDLQTLSGDAARALAPAPPCSRPPPALSTATPSCWRCAATPKLPARHVPFTRRCCTPGPQRIESNSTPAAARRSALHAGFSSMPPVWPHPRSRAASTACRST